MKIAVLGYIKDEFIKQLAGKDIASESDNYITLENGDEYHIIDSHCQLKGDYSQYDDVIDKDSLRKRFYVLYLKHKF